MREVLSEVDLEIDVSKGEPQLDQDKNRISIYSADGVLCHEVIRGGFWSRLDAGSRLDLSRPEEFLQVAFISCLPEQFFRPHVHLERSRQISNLRAQEMWMVLSGEVGVQYFDDNGNLLQTVVLDGFDLSISFRGGHSYKVSKAGAQVIEIKSGPYEGQKIDKKFID